jgi:hypothetical protein
MLYDFLDLVCALRYRSQRRFIRPNGSVLSGTINSIEAESGFGHDWNLTILRGDGNNTEEVIYVRTT